MDYFWTIFNCSPFGTRSIVKNEINEEKKKEEELKKKKEEELKQKILVDTQKKSTEIKQKQNEQTNSYLKESLSPDFLEIKTLIWSPKNLDSKKIEWQNLLKKGYYDPNDKDGLVFILKKTTNSLSGHPIYQILSSQEFEIKIRSDFFISSRIAVKKAQYALSLICIFYDFLGTTEIRINSIQCEPNCFELVNISMGAFENTIAKICQAINEQPQLKQIPWSQNMIDNNNLLKNLLQNQN